MKKVKKLLAMIMAMTMVLGMAMTVSAEKKGATINVSGLSTANLQRVDIYEIYKLDSNDNNWVKAQWAAGVTINIEEISQSQTWDQETLTNLKNAAAGTRPLQTGTTSSGSISFPLTGTGVELQAGAYLVLATDTASEVTYSPMVAITYEYNSSTNLIAVDDANVVAKADSWHTEKDIVEDTNNDDVYDAQDEGDGVYQVGDIVTYQIRTTVPYNKEEFTVTDTLTNAEYQFTGSYGKWEVTVGGETYTGIGAPQVTAGDEANTKTFTVDLKELLDDHVGQEVVITYNVKINGEADSITNTVTSSHDSDTDDEEKTTTAYTGQMSITKKARVDEGSAPTLEGAEFVIYRVFNEGAAGEYREYATLTNNKYIASWVHVDKSLTGIYKVPETAGRVVTNSEGIATVKGLDVGTYYFQEVVAPDGYSINPEDAKCIIVKNEEGNTVSVTGSTVMMDDKLASLPSTGGIGTTIFTIGGCAIMIAAAALYFASKRKSEEN